MCMCGKCKKVCGLLLLALGVVFLLGDLSVWNFWGINWWTAVLLLAGLCKVGASHCPECKKGH